MIISHSKRYIFVKTAKTAGSSVEAFLGKNFSSFSEFLREAPKGHLIHEHLQPLPDKIIFFEKLKKGLGELGLELDTRRLPHLKGDTREGPRKLWTGEDKEFFRRKMKKEYEFHKNLGYRL
jgi:hypothetical protein